MKTIWSVAWRIAIVLMMTSFFIIIGKNAADKIMGIGFGLILGSVAVVFIEKEVIRNWEKFKF